MIEVPRVPAELGRRFAAPLLVCLFLLSGESSLSAATAVKSWERTYGATTPGAPRSLAGRQLADGSTMLVAFDGAGLSARRYDGDGNMLSVAAFYPPYKVRKAAIDPFGSIAVLALTDECFTCPPQSSAWLMKYDGLSGRALWSRPALYGSGAYNAYVQTALILTPSGDVVAEISQYIDTSILKYDGRTGTPVFPPVALTEGVVGVLASDSAGNLIVTAHSGETYPDFATMKLDGQTGAVAWGPVVYDSGGIDYAQFIAVDGGGVVVVGFSMQPVGGVDPGPVMHKYDLSTGATLWGPVRYVDPNGIFADPCGLALGPPDELILCMRLQPPSGQSETLLLRYSSATGEKQWGPMPLGSHTPRLTLTGNGDILTDGFEFPGTGIQIGVRRFRHEDGSLLWGPFRDGPVGHPLYFQYQVVPTSGERIIIEYNLDDTTVPLPDVVTARSTDSGATVWTAPAFEGAATGLTAGKAMTTTPDGHVVVLGETSVDSTYVETRFGFVIAKYDAVTGAPIWGPLAYGSAAFVQPVQIAADAAGDVFVLSTRFGTSQTRLWKFSGATGVPSWPPVDLEGKPAALAVDSGGNVSVLSTVWHAAPLYADLSTARVSGTDGSLIWGPVHFDGGSVGDDVANGLVLLPSGDLVVAGLSTGGGSRASVIAYSAADGSVLWGPVAVPAIKRPGMGLAVGPAGQVVLAGGGEALATTMLNGSTGAVAWGPVYAGSDPSDAHGAAIDAAGNVIVTASFPTAPYHSEFATLKFAGSDGTLLWGPVTYQGAVAGRDAPAALALNGAGHAIVSGTSRNADGLLDVVTFQYDGASGATLEGPISTYTGASQAFGGLAVGGTRIFVGASSPAGMITTAYTEALGIRTSASDVPVAACGLPYAALLEAANGTEPYSWSVVSGELPPGLDLAFDGSLSGTPAGEGVFDYRVRVQDAAAAAAELDLTLRVADAGGIAPVLVQPSPSEPCAWLLSLPGSFASYAWLPDGESTATIEVEPSEPTTYGVVVTDADACLVHGAVASLAPRCIQASLNLTAVAPPWGPTSGGTSVTLTGTGFQAGATFFFDDLEASNVDVVSGTTITGLTPALEGGRLYDVRVTNPNTHQRVLADAFLADFADVLEGHPFHDDIARVRLAGITAGCGGGDYCPNNSVTRAQMAAFLLKGMLGPAYAPPPATGVIFEDVPSGSFAADWIEDLLARGITGGCAVSPLRYCPDQAVTRTQMAVLLLKAEHSSSFTPPSCIGVFADVECPGGFAVDWIEQLAAEGVTAGCGGGNYCPANPVTRGQMAVFLVKTFELP